MAYIRVLPRDLFNEGNLLKCYGQLWIALDTNRRHRARFIQDDVPRFDIRQQAGDGSIYVANINLAINGALYRLTRPLNSRAPWPLYAECEDVDAGDGEPVAVFNDDGTLSDEMRTLIQMPANG